MSAVAVASLAGVRVPAAATSRQRVADARRVRPAASKLFSRASRRGAVVMASGDIEKLQFLTPAEAVAVREEYGTPSYVYDMARLKEQAAKALQVPNAFGLTVRYAMKASPNAAILKVFRNAGLNIDASSGYEVLRAVEAGFDYSDISLSTQEFPDFFEELVEKGLKVNACSLSQLEAFAPPSPALTSAFASTPASVPAAPARPTSAVRPPLSASGRAPPRREGHRRSTRAQRRPHPHPHRLRLRPRGVDEDLRHVPRPLPRVPHRQDPRPRRGYKVGRMAHEQSTDLQVVGEPVKRQFEDFAGGDGPSSRWRSNRAPSSSPTRAPSCAPSRIRWSPPETRATSFSSSTRA